MAATNLLQFQAGLKAFEGLAEEKRRNRVKAVALRALRGVVMSTRVDTGRARGNWQVGETQPPTGTVDRNDKEGGRTIAAESRGILTASGDDIIWLHNGVPYAGVLEDKDAMVAGTVEGLRTWLRSGA